MRAAMLSESPREIEELLAAAAQLPDSGAEVRSESRLLDDRLSMLTKKAITEMRGLGRSKDFKAVMAAMMAYEEFPAETRQHWNILQQHWDDLVRAAKKRLRDLSTVADPLLLGRELEAYQAYHLPPVFCFVLGAADVPCTMRPTARFCLLLQETGVKQC